jgi:MEMO1 family protein
MARALPALRSNLDVMPSPVSERPGLLLRDPFRYTEDVLIVPPPLVPFLSFFDGGHDESDLKLALLRATGTIEVEGLARHLEDALGRGFLTNEAFGRLREERQRTFAAAPRREPVHAGSAYPEEKAALASALRAFLEGADASQDPPLPGVFAVAAPHVSPEGGYRSYAAAYRALPAGLRDRTFVVLGTSHYGAPERFGLTRKSYVTPLGEAAAAPALVDQLVSVGGPAVVLEDYCHAVEHSIEFQVLFLQHVYGPGVRVLPILCGPFARATAEGGLPEDDPEVRRFLGALGDLAAREGDALAWVLGVDMAHVGRRYGDPEAASAGEDGMVAVEERDRARLARLLAGDAPGFWAQVQENADDLRWCGASPLYTFLQTAGPVSGRLLRYEQWNIDPESVVTFAGLAFRREAAPRSARKGEA